MNFVKTSNSLFLSFFLIFISDINNSEYSIHVKIYYLTSNDQLLDTILLSLIVKVNTQVEDIIHQGCLIILDRELLFLCFDLT